MAITVIEYNDLEQVNNLFWSQSHDANIDRYRSNSVFRGIPNVNYHLATSFHRNCGRYNEAIEEALLRNFAKYAVIGDDSINKSIWKQLTLGQHHGLPTRLLDWTYSPLIAMHFATSAEGFGDMDKNDAVIWEIDICEMNEKMHKDYRKVLSDSSAYIMTIDMLDKLSEKRGFEAIKEYDRYMGSEAMLLIEPPSVDQRIISQFSYFSIVPSEMENRDDDLGIEEFLETTTSTKKHVISSSLKWRIRDMLDQNNINERTVYPGLDGLSQWLKRYYYVKRI